jgi:23S rRNA (pseudouridine1915-N3)-methyltransferase
MRFLIAAVGRLKDDAERVLVERYRKRIGNGRANGLGPMDIAEIAESRRSTAAERKADEAERLLKAASGPGVRVILDEAGRALSSRDLATWIAGQRDDGAAQINFLLGGPDGHAPNIASGARLVLSLGALTLPHGLARAVLAEQLYRATTIIAGHPYHRD